MRYHHVNIVIMLLVKSLPVSFGEELNDFGNSCNLTNSDRVEYEFHADIVGSEHIITFKGYFPKSTRENYVTAALRNAGVSLKPYYLKKKQRTLFPLTQYQKCKMQHRIGT